MLMFNVSKVSHCINFHIVALLKFNDCTRLNTKENEYLEKF